MGVIGDGECCLRERCKYALYSRFKEPRLYKYAVNGNWDLIPQRAKSHPNEAQFVHAFGSQDTPLHCILKSRALDLDIQAQRALDRLKFQAVTALLLVYQGAALTKNAFGRTPLHLACMDVLNVGEGVAQAILDANPWAASVQDMEGRSPLHYLVARNDRIPFSLLTNLISVCPEALEIKDSTKETPIDIVILRGDEIEDAAQILEFIQRRSNVHVPSLHVDSQNIKSSQSSKRSISV